MKYQKINDVIYPNEINKEFQEYIEQIQEYERVLSIEGHERIKHQMSNNHKFILRDFIGWIDELSNQLKEIEV